MVLAWANTLQMMTTQPTQIRDIFQTIWDGLTVPWSHFIEFIDNKKKDIVASTSYIVNCHSPLQTNTLLQDPQSNIVMTTTVVKNIGAELSGIKCCTNHGPICLGIFPVFHALQALCQNICCVEFSAHFVFFMYVFMFPGAINRNNTVHNMPWSSQISPWNSRACFFRLKTV